MRHSLIIVAFAVLLSHAPSGAQIVACQFGDDGFNLGCCVTPQPNLPQFPNIQIGGRYGCIRDCSLEAQFTYQLSIAFQWVLCDYAVIDIMATPTSPGATPIITRQLAKYSRTWMEVGATGVTQQVWRFLLNGYAQYGTAAVPPALMPCPVPPTVGAGIPVHMIGSIDYVCNPFGTTVNPFSVRLNLNHMIGCFSHAPFSTFPLAGAAAHNDRSYHLVAPANFVFAPVPTSNGPIAAESVRPSIFSWTPFNYICRTEERVAGGGLNTANQYCYQCPLGTSALPAIYANQSLQAVVACSGATTSISTLPIPGLLPTGMVTMGLGFWTPVAGNPAHIELSLHIAVLNYTDLCTGDGPIHVTTGVTTRSATNPVINFAPTGGTAAGPFQSAMDLGNVKILPISPPFTLPTPNAYVGWGSLFVSDLVINLNLP
jgi:hypothetical protein